MVLPPVETTPAMLMRFTSKASPEFITLVKDRLVSGGMIVVTEEETDDGIVLLGLTMSQAELEAEAEHIRYLMKTSDTKVMEYFTVKTRDEFLHPESESDEDLVERDADGLFTSNDCVLLVGRVLDAMTVLKEGEYSSNLLRQLGLHQQSSLMSYISSRNVTEQTQQQYAQQAKLSHLLEAQGYVDVITPVHLPRIRTRILRENGKWNRIMPPVDAISEYYGEQIAFYFAWMGHFTQMLILPGVLGLCVYLHRLYRGDDIETDELASLYGLSATIWGLFSRKIWKRRESRKSYWWGTFALSEYEKQHFFAVRAQFHGKLRRSPVTGQMETYYPATWRRLKYLVSAVLTTILLGVAFCVMILSLNIQGYIRPKSDPTRWTDEHPHPFYYPYFSILAEEGNLFDAASQWRCYLPVLLHSLCILAMNAMYRVVAERLTEWENHETEIEYQNSLILKRFLFEAFDCYIALFYLAFYERDIQRLRLELTSVFYIDTFRRLLLECGLPMLLQKLSRRKESRRIGQLKKSDDLRHAFTSSKNLIYVPLSEDADRDEYEQFDDYMEMVIQMGYITLFASAYPLASLIAIGANLVEIRADCFKLTRICRRPHSIRTSDLGMWNKLISAIIWLSALTNCYIFGLASQQLMQYLPDFYYLDELGHLRLVPGKGWIVVFIVFGFERVLIYAGLLIDQLVPDVPEDIADELERRQFLRMEETKHLRVSEELERERQQRSEEQAEAAAKAEAARKAKMAAAAPKMSRKKTPRTLVGAVAPVLPGARFFQHGSNDSSKKDE